MGEVATAPSKNSVFYQGRRNSLPERAWFRWVPLPYLEDKPWWEGEGGSRPHDARRVLGNKRRRHAWKGDV